MIRRPVDHTRMVEKFPSEATVQTILAMLQNRMEMDNPMKLTVGKSLRGVPRFRCASETNYHKWKVDIYYGKFYVVEVEGFHPDVCKSPVQVLTTLLVRCGIRDKGVNDE